MSPSLTTIKAGLNRTTEALAAELAQSPLLRSGSTTPAWNTTEWQLAFAAAAAHGVSPLLAKFSPWSHPAWQQFLSEQRAHVASRHERIERLLQYIDASAREAGLAIIPLKGSALHALGLYTAGDRPMADIDLLIHEYDVERTAALLNELGYVESFRQWKHHVFKPAYGTPQTSLGEHRDTPINIELHIRIQERLPVETIDITERIYSRNLWPGLNAYPSNGALMSHLLLHAAGNICGRTLRLIHLHDIALLASCMTTSDWHVLTDGGAWWAWPPLRLVAHYYENAIPVALLAQLERDCTPMLRGMSRRQTLTQVSCSNLWLQALPGIEWCRTAKEAGRYLKNRIKPTEETVQERADMVRTQLWLQNQQWVTARQGRRLLTWLTRPVPRMDAMYVINHALGSLVPQATRK